MYYDYGTGCYYNSGVQNTDSWYNSSYNSTTVSII